MSIVRYGYGEHHCKPPMGGERAFYGDRTELALGSIWECDECGKTYAVVLDDWGKTGLKCPKRLARLARRIGGVPCPTEVASRDTSDPGAAPTARGLASTSVEGADDDGR